MVENETKTGNTSDRGLQEVGKPLIEETTFLASVSYQEYLTSSKGLYTLKTVKGGKSGVNKKHELLSSWLMSDTERREGCRWNCPPTEP